MERLIHLSESGVSAAKCLSAMMMKMITITMTCDDNDKVMTMMKMMTMTVIVNQGDTFSSQKKKNMRMPIQLPAHS